MAISKFTSRREFLREYQSIAVQARRERNREVWERACLEFNRLATAAEKRKAPISITKNWSN